MKIILVSYRVDRHHKFSGYTHHLPPLGLTYIASVLLSKGHQVEIIDKSLPPGMTEILADEILSKGPDALGISMMSENYFDGIALLDALKLKQPDLITIIGGAHVNGLPKEAMAPESVDFGVLGEGEWVFADLVDSGFDPVDAKKIPGILMKDKAGSIHMNERALVRSVDTLPLPARHLVAPLEQYRPSILTHKQLPATGMFTSRGCFGKCIFCTSGKGKYPLRFHSTEYVLNEISQLWKKFGIREIVFLDDTFSASKKRVLEICNGIQQYFPTLSWSAQSRVDYLDYETLAAMRQAGCWQIQIGIESGSEQILENLGKGINLDQVESVSRYAYELGFIIKGYFIIGSPGETKESIMKTFRLMRKLPIHYASINLLVPLPGTVLWDNASKWGTFDPDSFYKFNYLTGEPVFIPQGMTKQELMELFDKAYRQFYLSPGTIYRNLKTIRSLLDLKRYLNAGALMTRMLLHR